MEFGLIAPFFFGLLFGIVEVALTFWSTQVLETAVANAAREIYTGSFQQGATSLTQADALAKFKTSVCNNIKAVFNCNALVKVDVQKYTSFSGTTITPPVKNGVFDTSTFGYNTGLKSGNRLIMASSTFRTEPY